MRTMLVVVLAAAACHGDCEETTCGAFCAGMGEAADPDLVFQECIANTSSSGGDFVLRDESGEKVYECSVAYDALGQETGTCTTDFLDARYEYCGCSGGTYSTYR